MSAPRLPNFRSNSSHALTGTRQAIRQRLKAAALLEPHCRPAGAARRPRPLPGGLTQPRYGLPSTPRMNTSSRMPSSYGAYPGSTLMPGSTAAGAVCVAGVCGWGWVDEVAAAGGKECTRQRHGRQAAARGWAAVSASAACTRLSGEQVSRVGLDIPCKADGSLPRLTDGHPALPPAVQVGHKALHSRAGEGRVVPHFSPSHLG